MPTCTSPRPRSSRAKRRPTGNSATTSPRACTWCRASARSCASCRFDQGRPVWVDDPHLNLDYHVRQTALPAPGSDEQLRNLAARIFSQQLDRSKPLWELWLVEGLTGDRFAIIGKSHHALVDGVSGVDITTVLFDLDPDPAGAAEKAPPWLARPEPTNVQLLSDAWRERLTSPPEIYRGFRAALRGPPSGAEGHRRDLEDGQRRDVRPPLRLQRRDRAPPPLPDDPDRPRRPQARQGRPRRHRQRRHPLDRRRRHRPLPARPRPRHRGAGAAGDGPGQRPRRRGARRPRQPDLGDDGAAAGLVRGPGRAAAADDRRDGRPQVLRPGGRGRDPHQTDRLRPLDDRLAGGPAAAGAALLQPRRHQRAGAAVPALRARPQDGVDLPDGPPGPSPGPLRRDHVLQRPGQLRPDRRLRRDGRPRQLRPRPRSGDRRGDRDGPGQEEAEERARPPPRRATVPPRSPSSAPNPSAAASGPACR